ncbi:cupin domain-containing protein [Nostoc sp. PCC 7107]|uniref:cupin domain-containing protein n=1 Tax=Nostoc sp. PCC 7107 TaxID=317936 RepID=UPI00029F4C04|nr:cupin domain-containing protein [Nostoc sp. PCC 7107]AFY43037.1 transcription factor jumonji jmjC domain-containing protein [Nostoc sp. PCC 7107]
MKTLQQLLAPYPIDQFLTEFWTKKAIHIPAEHDQKLQNIFTWKSLNDLLNYHKLKEPDLRFSMNGKSLSETRNRQEWSDRLRQGATLIINGVHHRVATVAELAANLRHDIGYETHVNLYCSPAKQQGFDCHYDTHDVLILQIDGEKQWFVYQETVQYPTAHIPSSKQQQPQEPPYLECVLKAGDLLYIPRGHWHYAVACEQPSLHLTIGIECQTGLDWLNWLMKDLRENVCWRESLPAIANGNTNVIEQQLNTLRQHLIETLHQPDIFQRYIETLNYQHQPSLLVNLPTQIGTNIFPDLFMTRFSWSPLHRIRIQQIDKSQYQVRVGAKQIDIKGIPENLVENLFNSDEFSLFNIVDWSPDLDLEGDVIPLITRLVSEGILLVKSD